MTISAAHGDVMVDPAFRLDLEATFIVRSSGNEYVAVGISHGDYNLSRPSAGTKIGVTHQARPLGGGEDLHLVGPGGFRDDRQADG
jgi:hypothetical protein